MDNMFETEWERSIGIRREYTYDAKTGQPLSYKLSYGNPIPERLKRPKLPQNPGEIITPLRKPSWIARLGAYLKGKST